MTPKLIIPVRYSKHLYSQLIFWQYYRNPFMKLLSLGGILSLLLCLLYLVGYNPLNFKLFPFFGLLYGLLTLLIPSLLYLRIQKAFKDVWLFKEEIIFQLDAEQITANASVLKRTLRWEELFSVFKHRKAWLFFTNKKSFVFIPREILSPEQDQQINHWAQQYNKL